MIRRRHTAAAVLVLAAGCGPDAERPEFAAHAVDGATLPGVYAGRFPCANCAGIDVTLWLVDDGVFFMRQDVITDEAPPERVHAWGHWLWNPTDAVAILEGRGPERELAYDGKGHLVMATFSDTPHVLERASDAGDFSDAVQLQGVYAPGRYGDAVVECVTGLVLAVTEDAGARILRSRHRAISKPEVPALVTVEGRFLWPEPEERTGYSVAVSELVSMRPRTTCDGAL
jgi:hypothetical protein